jgi:MoaA/NifB/PqqE/SkfB family radical SAM enzyme
MKILYERNKKHPDRTVRCYLTLQCTNKCPYCSAGIPQVDPLNQLKWIPAEEWAYGLNQRNRACVLAGGEPFLYPEFGKLISLLKRTYPTWIYSNLEADPSPLIENATKPFPILASLHWCDFNKWYEHLKALWDAGHFVKFHVVKSGNHKPLLDFLERKGIVGKYNTHLCGDQGAGIRSRGKKVNELYPKVMCSNRIFLYGPDGYRYPCVSKLGKMAVEDRYEHIIQDDSEAGKGFKWLRLLRQRLLNRRQIRSREIIL